MLHINKIKTWNGTKYAVVEPYTSYVTTESKKVVAVTDNYPIEYKLANKKLAVAVFPLTDEGLAKAREVRSLIQ